ncbi:DUF115 domain-containing protein [Shewanella sp. JM162201]|uniref:DUF115 domain-containing protein n=1 Tax=Shewanella jiangmenensis TaxID=2837387 RepID=A0ABS5V3A2_9GAMM|nr:6-hydroxymethylpterin diphosphokinase MptE-like protein [Shewanella jiangmenensis]MBT1444924.1 DUF115 domain-containing protein [Shewanella jiangmenensis]
MSIETTVPAIFSVSQFGETYLPGVNRKLFESQPSTAIFSGEYSKLFALEHHLYVIVGMDSGLLANYVLEHPLPAGSRYLFVELDAVLAMMNIDIPDPIKGKVQVLSLTEFESQIEQAPFPVYFTKKATQIYKSQGAKFAHVADYVNLCSKVEKIVEQQIFKHSIGLTQKQFVSRQLENLPDNQIRAKVLKDSFSGKDCVILAGGPSLDEHLPWVIEHREHLVIIAVSRISRRLLTVGLIPDIVVSVDPQEVSYDVSKEMLKFPESVLFINCNHVEPRLLANWQGQSAFLGEQLPWQEPSHTSNIQSEGPTVTNSALHLAIKMGFCRIFLSGTDLCYASNGVTHAQGSHEASVGANMVVNGEWVDTYSGTKAETSIQMLHALQALEAEVKLLSAEQSVFNLSANAAKAEGISCINTADVHLKSIIKDKTATLTRLTAPLSREQKLKHLNDMTSQLKQASGQLEEVISLGKAALKCNASLKNAQKVSTHTDSYYRSLIGRIDDIEKQLNQKFVTMSQFIKFFGFAEFTDFLNPADSDEWQQNEMLAMTDAYYRAYVSSSEQLKSLIQQGLERLAFRKSELNPTANIRELLAGWDKFREWGRAVLWQKYHPTPAEFLSQFHAFSEKHHATIDAKPELAKRIEAINTLLTRVESKLLLLKSSRNQIGLTQMTAILKNKAQTDEQALRLYRLAQAFSYQLHGQPNKALESLLKLDEPLLTEREYKEIASLSLALKKPEITRLALEKLTGYSDQYLPLYANVLKIIGQYQQSADTYLKYLNRYPADVLTWIKFGEFMMEAGERDMAIMAFHQAEHAEPGNVVAKHYLAELYHR